MKFKHSHAHNSSTFPFLSWQKLTWTSPLSLRLRCMPATLAHTWPPWSGFSVHTHTHTHVHSTHSFPANWSQATRLKRFKPQSADSQTQHCGASEVKAGRASAKRHTHMLTNHAYTPGALLIEIIQTFIINWDEQSKTGRQMSKINTFPSPPIR